MASSKREPEAQPIAYPEFAERFAFLKFLKHLHAGRAPTNRDIAEGVGVTDAAVIGWSKRREAPTSYAHVKALIEYFAIPQHETWFITGRGAPPELSLWTRWLLERRPAEAAEVRGNGDDGEAEAPSGLGEGIIDPHPLEEDEPAQKPRRRRKGGGRA